VDHGHDPTLLKSLQIAVVVGVGMSGWQKLDWGGRRAGVVGRLRVGPLLGGHPPS